MSQINEKVFFEDVYAEDALGGHGQSNQKEYFASFMVSLEHSVCPTLLLIVY